MERIRLGIIDEHEVFRRGVGACLSSDPLMIVVFESSTGPVGMDLDVAVVSPLVAGREHFECPLVICGPSPNLRPAAGNIVRGVLPRSTLTAEQLVAAVRAAAAGLRISTMEKSSIAPHGLDSRNLEVLRLLAQGATTREIAENVRYSERTIKALVHDIERVLGARSRAQAVAEGIRQGLV